MGVWFKWKNWHNEGRTEPQHNYLHSGSWAMFLLALDFSGHTAEPQSEFQCPLLACPRSATFIFILKLPGRTFKFPNVCTAVSLTQVRFMCGWSRCRCLQRPRIQISISQNSSEGKHGRLGLTYNILGFYLQPLSGGQETDTRAEWEKGDRA